MNLSSVGFGRSFPRLWIVPIVGVVAVLALAVIGIFSRAVLADLFAWWPVWTILTLMAVLLRHRTVGVVRLAGLVPILAIAAVGLFAWGHVAGWTVMPSSSQRLVGPEPGEYAEASLAAEIDGQIELSGGGEFLYLVEVLPGGGQIGIPSAAEVSMGDRISVDLVPPTDAGLFTFAGWEISLNHWLSWSLILDGAVTADLTALTVANLDLDGSGVVFLGQPGTSAEVRVSGQFDISIPGNAQASVVGVASVPATWTLTSDGAESPNGGDGGWRIIVDADSTVRVVEG